jgi:hypothetical protein
MAGARINAQRGPNGTIGTVIFQSWYSSTAICERTEEFHGRLRSLKGAGRLDRRFSGGSAVPFFSHYYYNSTASILSFEVSPSMTSMPPVPPEILARSGKRRVFPIGKWWGSMFADRFVWLLAKTS